MIRLSLRPATAAAARATAPLAALLVAAALFGCRPADRPGDQASAAAGAPFAYPAAAVQAAGGAGRVAFVAERDALRAVYVLDLATGAQTPVARLDEHAYPMAALPGGDLLVASATVDEGPAHRERLWRYAAARDTLVLLPLDASMLRHPVVAPGGAAFVFESSAASMRDLYRYDLANGRVDRLTDHPAGNFDPSLSPGGDAIAFASSRDGQAELYVMPASGEGRGGARLRRLTDVQGDDMAPRFSPAADRVAFVSAREGNARVFLVRSDGTDLVRLLADADTLARGADEGIPVWSPDGQRLAFPVTRPGGGSELWVADVATRRRWRIAAGLYSASQPAWSPDGRALVFAGIPTEHGDGDLYLVAADGAGATVRLTADAGADWLPVWLNGAPAGPRSAGR